VPVYVDTGWNYHVCICPLSLLNRELSSTTFQRQLSYSALHSESHIIWDFYQFTIQVYLSLVSLTVTPYSWRVAAACICAFNLLKVWLYFPHSAMWSSFLVTLSWWALAKKMMQDSSDSLPLGGEEFKYVFSFQKEWLWWEAKLSPVDFGLT
jgi:hypothetical protein